MFKNCKLNVNFLLCAVSDFISDKEKNNNPKTRRNPYVHSNCKMDSCFYNHRILLMTAKTKIFRPAGTLRYPHLVLIFKVQLVFSFVLNHSLFYVQEQQKQLLNIAVPCHVFLAFQCKGFFLFGFGFFFFFCQCSDNKAQLQTLNSTPFTFVSFTQSSADGHISIKPLLFCRATHKQACLKREKKMYPSIQVYYSIKMYYSIQVASPLGYYNSQWRTETNERICFQECLVSICIYPVNCHLFSYSQKSG